MTTLEEVLAEPGPPDADGNVTLACPDCGQKITGAPRGKGSATWKLGTHRYTKHGKRGGGKAPRARAGAPSSDDLASHPVVATVTSISSVMTGTGVPSTTELAGGLGRGIGLISVGAASLIVDTDPSIPDGPDGDKLRDYLIDWLSLDDDAARGVMTPVARMFAPSKLNQKYGRGVVDNIDVIGSLFEVGTLAMHWRRMFRMRAAGGVYAHLTAAAAAGPVQAPGGVPFTPDGPPAEPPPFSRDLTSPPPQEGRVMSAADIEALQRQGAR